MTDMTWKVHLTKRFYRQSAEMWKKREDGTEDLGQDEVEFFDKAARCDRF